jgi:predicted nucleotidyltransferase
MNPFLEVLKTLDQSGSRFVIVGGFAVVMYGSNRFTPDVNVVLELDQDNLEKGIKALKAVGLESELCDEPLLFAAEDSRKELQSSNQQRFFPFRNYEVPFFSVDLFYDYPVPFENLYSDSHNVAYDSCSTRICSIEHLIEMKKEAARAQDLLDLANLEAIRLIGEFNFSAQRAIESIGEFPTSIDEERIRDLVSFLKTSPQEKMKWLEDMLSALGHFSSF